MKIKKIANVLLVCILVFSSFQITEKVIDYQKSEKLYSEIYDIVADSEKNIIGSDSNIEDTTDVYDKMKEINSDYKFWVEVENTNISYPVVQGTDNNHYLHYDFNNQKNSSGTIFMDTSNYFDYDNNIVLYGHNMRNKTMFNNVTLFKQKDFFNQNNKIKIKYTEDNKEYIYEVFSAYHTDNSFDYNRVIFDENYTFNDFINDIKKKSKFKSNLEVSEDDKIITLSTCSYEFKGAKTTIHAKLIETK